MQSPPRGVTRISSSVPAPQPGRTPWQHVFSLLAAAFACLLGLGASCALFIWTADGQLLDQRFQRPTAGLLAEDGMLGYARTVLAWLGEPSVLVGLLVVVVLVGAASGRIGAGLLGVVVVGGSAIGARMLKLVLSRPDLGLDDSTTHNSFPSGHVAVAAGLVFAVLLAMPACARWWCAIPGLAAVSVVGVATVLTGWHRPSDVIGGVLLAATLCFLAAACLALSGRRGQPLRGLRTTPRTLRTTPRTL